MRRQAYPQLGEELYSATLANGLRLRIVPKQGFARSYAFLAVDFGAIDTAFTLDGRKQRVPDGIAHYLEHKMFDLPEGNAMELFAAHGGSPNAFTGYDMTAYYFSGTEEFEENLKLLLRMVITPYFTDESVEKERGIIAQEIRMYDDSAASRVGEELFRAQFGRHPIRVPIAGTVESIGEITAQMLYDCHAAFYQPANMSLCLVTDADPAALCALVEAALPAAAAALPQRDYGEKEPMRPVTAEHTMQMCVSMPTFSVGFKCEPPQKGMQTMCREIIGDLAAELLAGESSPLYVRLYDEGLIDSDFSGDYEGVKDACLLSFSGDSCDPQAVYAAILEEAKRLNAEGFDQALFDRLKKSALGRRMRDLDSFESICYRICAYEFDAVEYFRFPEAYACVTAQEVREFLQTAVQPERAAISVIYPQKEQS